ncbi:hypothetical protein [Dyella sp. Tek66A03]|uniref:hypothetical protein n=1 Tax=Dyella sp. Tek66A03 TaxID=3458298 RepID=UPI00403E52EC
MPIERTTSLPNINTAVVVKPPRHRTQSAPDLGEISALSEDLHKLSHDLDGQSEYRWKEVLPIFDKLATALDEYGATVRGGWSDYGGGVNAVIADIVDRALDGGEQLQVRSLPNPEARCLVTALHGHLDEQAAVAGHQLSSHERALAVFHFLGNGVRAITNNDFEDPRARWAANFTNVVSRTGLIVGVTTTARQLIGFGIEKAVQLGEVSMTKREVLGASAMMLGMGLNIAGFIRDEVYHTGNEQSRAARLVMFAMSVGALTASSVVSAGTSAAGAETVLSGLMRSFGPQMATYTLARDMVQAFFPLRDNAPINVRGTAAEAMMYGTVQYSVGEAMDHWASNSGAGFAMKLASGTSSDPVTTRVSDEVTNSVFNWAMSTAAPGTEASHESRTNEALKAIAPELSHDFRIGFLNAAAEIFDDIVRPLVARDIRVRDTVQATEREAIANGEDPRAAVARLPARDIEGLRIGAGARFPNASEVADQFLTTSAMRTSSLQVIVHGAMTVTTLLAGTNLSNEAQGRITRVVVGVLAAAIYVPFLHAHVQRAPAPEQAPIAEYRRVQDQPEMQLRNRRVTNQPNSSTDESEGLNGRGGSLV